MKSPRDESLTPELRAELLFRLKAAVIEALREVPVDPEPETREEDAP